MTAVSYTMLSKILKKIFWVNFDYIWSNVLLSLMWIGINIPFFFLFATLILNKNYHLEWFLLLFNFLLISPISAGLSYALLPQINDQSDRKKTALFLEGFKKFGLRAIMLFIISSAFLFISLFTITFYLKKYSSESAFFFLLLAGLIFLVALFFLMMQSNFNALLVRQDEKISRIVYKSFLLVLGNPGIYIFLSLFLLSVGIILTFSIFGLVLILPVFHFLSWDIIVLMLLSKYNPNITVDTEDRSWRALFKPWN